MEINTLGKEKLKNAFMKQFDNPKDLGQHLIENEKEAMKEAIDDNKSAYGYPDSVKSDDLINYLEMYIYSKIDAEEWLEFAGDESSYDLLEPKELEALSNDDNAIVELILMNFDNGCSANILLPMYEDYIADVEMPENFKAEINSYLRETPIGVFKQIIRNYSDRADIQDAIKRAGEQEGIPQYKLNEITNYDFKNIKITIAMDVIASRYKGNAQREGVKSFVENHLYIALVVDGLVTYDIEILDNPEDF